MEIRTIHRSYLCAEEDSNINEAMDVIVCALILEGYHVKTIHEALLGKAESMIQEFNLKEE